MYATKEEQLDQCHAMFLDMCFGDLPMDMIDHWVHPKISGYGTNINEKIQSLLDFTDLLQIQRDESVGLNLRFDFTPVSKNLLAEQNAALFVDEARLSMTVAGSDLMLNLRISTVFEYMDGQWWVVHFHGSLPQGEVGDRDTWSANEWMRKNAELEQIIRERTDELRRSVDDLKSAQAQLIQSEKMASLGELTAGIAHEIKNPLNFVNNFAEVSHELLGELEVETDPDQRAEIIQLLQENLEKITHHGKRADGIVRSMLQHSRSGTGKKEPTDLNALIDEYTRLAYHGLRAREKSFNAEIRSDLDPDLPMIDVVPEEMGRVLLNLINNAFYAVAEKQRTAASDYIPTVHITTRHAKEQVEIRIADNGVGIAPSVAAKIFQPFFTTKPTGQGTGLGLSLSYDIVQAHGGSLSAEAGADGGAAFVIRLPARSV